jgi:hypothetical protein
MGRIHAFEFEDLQWFPRNLRNYATDFLQFGANAFDMYKEVIPILQKGIDKAGNNTIIDIASGGGGGLITIARHLKKQNPTLKIILTDFYPNLEAFKRTQYLEPEIFEYISTPVDAMAVPPSLKGLRTQFLSLHHFKPEHVKHILQNAIDNHQSIAIFEGQQRTVKSMIPMLFSPISVLLSTPFLRPFKPDRLLFTYLIPVLPLVVMWDGIISVLRTYTVEELNSIILELNHHEQFDWEVGIAKGKPVDVGFLLGTPKNQST